MLEILLLAFLGFKNYRLAKTKGLHGVRWFVITDLAFLATYMIGMYVVIVFGLHSKVVITADMGKAQIDATVKQVTQEFLNNPILMFAVYGFGIGGYLLIRFLLERKPGKKTEPMNWMDRVNNNSENS